MPDIHSVSSNFSPDSIPAGAYVVDTARSVVTFRAKAFGAMWVRGNFPIRDGSIEIGGGKLAGTGVLAADEISTGLAPRDWHLRSSHYLHTREHPTVQVAIENVDLSDESVPCEVTVRGTTAPVRLQLRSVKAGDGALELVADVTLDRTVFPMLGPWAGVSRLVHLGITIVALSGGE
ncbi:YceI family protein (plasmid) [Rhodococcus sp. USK10]|uniref:YceI family protein n=1 Tax=Rhodococcus sp. USK10 TaxID=2789739 RepID=UPI001C5ED5AC|nr:YceI family protein [Rhodococcus sp. USK10]QYA99835.1 YceI family protein [Rhodococcus sp. USK10]